MWPDHNERRDTARVPVRPMEAARQSSKAERQRHRQRNGGTAINRE